MKRTTTQVAITAISLLCSGLYSFAQTDYPKYEFGFNLGFLVYQGDLTPQRLGSFPTQKFSIGLQAGKIFSRSFSLRASLLRSGLEGNDAIYDKPEYRQQRNFYFTSPVTELTAQMVWNITASNYKGKGFSPYVFAGGGVSFVNIKRDWSRINPSYFEETGEIWTGLALDTVHSVPGVLAVIPIGAGVKYFFTPNWALNAETTYRLVSTDYLDGFSEAANPAKKDKYLGYTIGLIYRTGNKNRLACPVVRY